MPQMFDDVGEIVEEALRRVGRKVVLALPLGIGKPNLIANEFFRRARADRGLDLTIVTALSLRKPTGSSDLERRFIDPLAERVFGNYPALEYLEAMRTDAMPPNVRVIEFFFEPGAMLRSAHAQSHYLSANYTHVTRELVLSRAEVNRLKDAGDPQAAWLFEALRFYVDFHKEYEDLDGCVVNDVLPIAALIDPSVLTFTPVKLAVGLDDGDQRGRTKRDDHGHAAMMATAVHTKPVKTLLFERVLPWAGAMAGAGR